MSIQQKPNIKVKLIGKPMACEAEHICHSMRERWHDTDYPTPQFFPYVSNDHYLIIPKDQNVIEEMLADVDNQQDMWVTAFEDEYGNGDPEFRVCHTPKQLAEWKREVKDCRDVVKMFPLLKKQIRTAIKMQR